jgi:prophage regulatory protein
MVQMQYLNFADLRSKLGGRSRAAIYVDMKVGRFPKPLKLGGRVYWPEEVVDAHLAAMREEA